MEHKDIETLLERWYLNKKKIAELEEKSEKYKRCAELIMNNKDTNEISSCFYKLKRREITRTSISKKDVPKDLWDRYSCEHTYPTYYLTEKK